MFYEDELKEQRRQAYKEGYADGLMLGHEEALISSIKALMKSMRWSAQQAMDVLDVPSEKQKKLTALL